MELAGDDFELPQVDIIWLDSTADFYYEKQFGPYKIGARLGSGTYGMVKAAKHGETQKSVAVKLITKTHLSNIEKQTVKTEAEVMSFLCHKNIVSLFAVFENRNQIGMVMEYAGGGELLDYITRRTRLSEVEARKFFIQLLDGIGYAHSKRIIHRDIKAENVFLDEKLETIKIGDWGFACVYKSAQVNEFQCGTLHYAAPEILSQGSSVGSEVDVWAIGVLLYFMVCGWLPFRGTTDFEIFSKIRRGEYKSFPSHISDDLKDLLVQIFSVDRLVRPTIDTLQRHPWCLQARVDPEYLKRPRLPRLLLHDIRQFQFQPKVVPQPSKILQDCTNIMVGTTELTNSNIPELISEALTTINSTNQKKREKKKKTTEASENSEDKSKRKHKNRKRKDENGKKRRTQHKKNYQIFEEDEENEVHYKHSHMLVPDNIFPEDIMLDSPIKLISEVSSLSRPQAPPYPITDSVIPNTRTDPVKNPETPQLLVTPSLDNSLISSPYKVLKTPVRSPRSFHPTPKSRVKEGQSASSGRRKTVFLRQKNFSILPFKQ